MSPERVRHTRSKGLAFIAFRRDPTCGRPCEAFAEGITVRIRDDRAFVPDALVVCPPPADVVEIDDPLIVVEVVSPSTAGIDYGVKLEGYFSLARLAHYLILDPDSRMLIHHRRRDAGLAETRILREGALRLEPPGLEVQVEDLFGPVTDQIIPQTSF